MKGTEDECEVEFVAPRTELYDEESRKPIKVEYCDLKNIDIATIFKDGLHPNDKGYYIMYKILMKELGLAYQMPGSEYDPNPERQNEG